MEEKKNARLELAQFAQRAEQRRRRKRKECVWMCECDDWVWSLTKQPGRSGSGRAQAAPAAGVAWAWARQPGKQREKKWCDINTKTSSRRCTRGGRACYCHYFSSLQHFFSPKGGCYLPLPSPKAQKQTTVALASAGAESGVNTGCCDVCVVSEWPCVVDIPDTEACGAVFFSCRVRCFERPTSPRPLPFLRPHPHHSPTSPGAHLLSRDNQTNDFHCC